MIKDFVQTLKDYGIEDYIKSNTSITASVKLGSGNISDFTSEPVSTNGPTLIVTVIKIEEEGVLKNFPNQRIKSVVNEYKIDKRFSKVHLNYYLQFSSVLGYDTAIAVIHRIIKFFQYHKKIKFKSDEEELELNLELFSPTFEQLNNIWGMSGGKQLPSVIYKARVASLEKDEEQVKPLINVIGATLE